MITKGGHNCLCVSARPRIVKLFKRKNQKRRIIGENVEKSPRTNATEQRAGAEDFPQKRYHRGKRSHRAPSMYRKKRPEAFTKGWGKRLGSEKTWYRVKHNGGNKAPDP